MNEETYGAEVHRRKNREVNSLHTFMGTGRSVPNEDEDKSLKKRRQIIYVRLCLRTELVVRNNVRRTK